MKMLSTMTLGCVLGMSLLTAGCNTTDTDRPKGGTYTAARRNAIGSHIPQPYSADSAGTTVSTAEAEREAERASNVSMRSGGGGGGR